MIDTVAYINSGLATSYSEESAEVKKDLGKDDFMTLMIMQFQNQDPLEPMEDTEFLAQMAQFSSLEQMQNMNDGLEQNLAMDTLLGQLLNKYVEGARLMAVTQPPWERLLTLHRLPALERGVPPLVLAGESADQLDEGRPPGAELVEAQRPQRVLALRHPPRGAGADRVPGVPLQLERRLRAEPRAEPALQQA